MAQSDALVPQIPVLNYHHVHDEAESFFRVTPATLRAQMEFLLGAGYRPIDLQALLTLKGASSVNEKYALVTFDDAYDDFFANAWPVLKPLQIPITLFVISGYIGDWNDWDPIRESRRRHLDRDQLQYLRDEGVTLASHTQTHLPLVVLGERPLLAEIRDSKCVLEQSFEAPIRALAYPGGHVNQRVRDATAEHYELGFATTTDATARCCDAYLIPRFDPSFCGDLYAFHAELVNHCGQMRTEL